MTRYELHGMATITMLLAKQLEGGLQLLEGRPGFLAKVPPALCPVGQAPDSHVSPLKIIGWKMNGWSKGPLRDCVHSRSGLPEVGSVLVSNPPGRLGTGTGTCCENSAVIG